MKISLFALLFASSVIAQDTSLAQVRRAFINANIPADASLTFKPTSLLEVTFPQASDLPVRVNAGIQLKRNQTAIPPIFAIQRTPFSNTPSGPLVIAMVDLDAPTPQTPTNAQIRHFLGGNFDLTRGFGLEPLRNATPAISQYRQPTPSAGSDPHRYVFLLFEQSPGFNSQTLVTPTTSIINFNISDFAEQIGLGNPIGGTFILVGPDPTPA